MARPVCPECGGSDFAKKEVKSGDYIGSSFCVCVVYCTDCGYIVGCAGGAY